MSDQSTLIAFLPNIGVDRIVRRTGGDAGDNRNIISGRGEGDFWLQAGGSVIVTMFAQDPRIESLRKVHLKVDDCLLRPSGKIINGVARDERPPLTFLTWMDYNARERNFTEMGAPFATINEGNKYEVDVNNGRLGDILYCVVARGLAATTLSQQLAILRNA